MQIVPMRDLKDTVKIEALCSEENGPVFVTKNGYGRLVVMDIEYFERTMNKLYEAATLAKGIEDSEKGNTRSGDEVMQEMRLKYGI
ncbi:MAG TPA: antitoxin PHD [Ruminococcaceae bacterium]|nr:antitoxin PHD [Oscillospiraceae bacterium]